MQDRRFYWIALVAAAVLGPALMLFGPWLGIVAATLQVVLISERLAAVGHRRRLALWAPGGATMTFVVCTGIGSLLGVGTDGDGWGLMGVMVGLVMGWVVFHGVGVWAGLQPSLDEFEPD